MAVDGDINGPAESTLDDSGDIDVCIVSFNSASMLAETVASIAVHVPAARIAIREHGSDPGALETLRRVADEATTTIRLEFDATNPGFGTGCNALAWGGTARWILFLNPDARILSWPWTTTDPPPEGAVIGPLMVGVGQPERHSGVTYRITDEIKRSWFRRSGPRPTGRGFVSGAALLIDRTSFERVGGFDERYFMFYEDIDLCLRANHLGIVTVIEPSWRVRHEGAHSTSCHFAQSLIWSYESACRFRMASKGAVFAYQLYVIADSVIRSLGHRLRRRGAMAGSYERLMQRAFIDLICRKKTNLPGSVPGGLKRRRDDYPDNDAMR